jgi:hypothetical protein
LEVTALLNNILEMNTEAVSSSLYMQGNIPEVRSKEDLGIRKYIDS